VGLSGIVVVVGLTLVALVAGISVLIRERRLRVLRKRYGDAAMPARQGFAWRTLAPFVLLVGAGASIILAFGNVRLSHQATTGTVILAVDVSRSMDNTDVAPNRLEAAQAAAQSFLQQLPAGFKVGVVTFAGSATVLVAPTADRTKIAGAIDTLSTSNGTVIGDGLSQALDTIDTTRRATGDDPAAVVLLTDGQDTGSTVSPDDAAQRAKTDDVKVFTVAVGAADNGTKGANTGLLAQLATTTDAQTFTAASAGQLTEVYRSLGSELSSDLAISRSSTGFVALAAALAIAAGISLVVLQRNV
jgi:Ca-activated chloride channel family protein